MSDPTWLDTLSAMRAGDAAVRAAAKAMTKRWNMPSLSYENYLTDARAALQAAYEADPVREAMVGVVRAAEEWHEAHRSLAETSTDEDDVLIEFVRRCDRAYAGLVTSLNALRAAVGE